MPACTTKPPHVNAVAREKDIPVRGAINAEQLFAGEKEIIIRHQGECYRLRRTSKGKLILTK